MSITASAIVCLVVKPIKATIKFDKSISEVAKLSGSKMKYFKADSQECQKNFRRVYIDDVKVHSVTEMYAAKEPGVTVQGFALVFTEGKNGKYLLNKLGSGFLRTQINGMIRWEYI